MPWKELCLATGAATVVLFACGSFIALPSAFFFSPTTKGSAVSLPSSGHCQKRSNGSTTSLCYPFIDDYQECLDVKGLNATYTPQSGSFTEADLKFTLVLSLLQPKENCKVALVPILCLYFFPICDDTGAALHPDAGYCEEISSSVCKEEWNVAIAMGIESLLPQCGLLPSEPSFLNRKCIDEIVNISAVTLVLNNSTTHLYCGEDFVLFNGTCRPRCDSWESSGGVRLKISSILAAAIGIVSEIAFLSAAVVNRKVMLTFPKVLVVYMDIDILVITALLFINYSDREALFCSSSDLITSIDHPSVFCNLSGAMLIYQNLQLSVLWFCHVSVMFLKLNFPFHARSLEVSGHNRYIHALCVAASLLVPIAPIAATFATDGFSMAQFPPFFCFPKNGAVIFYSLVLPVIILLVIGTAMLAAVIWNVHKHHGLLRERHVGTNQPALPPVSNAERKLLLTSLYYVIIGTIATVTMSITAKNGNTISLKLGEHFLCSSVGTSTLNCQQYKDEANMLMNTEMIAASFMLTTWFPIIHLFYACSFSKRCKKNGSKQINSNAPVPLKTMQV
ncbi:hypothetical protein EMCRGX_G016516 [Ephydatia muelleri]|eukprot:Em0008g794a